MAREHARAAHAEEIDVVALGDVQQERAEGHVRGLGDPDALVDVLDRAGGRHLHDDLGANLGGNEAGVGRRRGRRRRVRRRGQGGGRGDGNATRRRERGRRGVRAARRARRARRQRAD